jgi:biopolymer transport protein ExbD
MNVGSSPGVGESQDFELNIASLIDCFTVLITFLLASASFLSIGILDAGVAAAGHTATDTATPPPINLVVEVGHDKHLELKITGKENRNTALTATKDGAWDFVGLDRELASIKAKYPTVSAVTLTAENSVEYRDVIKSMEMVKKSLPVVLLGGF